MSSKPSPVSGFCRVGRTRAFQRLCILLDYLFDGGPGISGRVDRLRKHRGAREDVLQALHLRATDLAASDVLGHRLPRVFGQLAGDVVVE
jgi:hypothetical protein